MNVVLALNLRVHSGMCLIELFSFYSRAIPFEKIKYLIKQILYVFLFNDGKKIKFYFTIPDHFAAF